MPVKMYTDANGKTAYETPVHATCEHGNLVKAGSQFWSDPERLKSEIALQHSLTLTGPLISHTALLATAIDFGPVPRTRLPGLALNPAGGLGVEGLSYELKFLARHLPGTEAAKKLIAKGDAAHVFNDVATLSRVEAALLREGKYLGLTRGAERYGLRFKNPIGYRIDASGCRVPLHYGELKLSTATGKYHIIPRTGPSIQ